MKTLKRLTAGVVLMFVLAVAAFAGKTSTPPCANPGETSAPPCSTSQPATSDSTDPGQTSTPPASDSVDVVSISDVVYDMLMVF